MVVPFQKMEFAHSLFSAITLVTVPFIPESPVFLLSRGKLENAEKSLKWLRGGGDDVDVGDEMKEARAKKASPRLCETCVGLTQPKTCFKEVKITESPSTSFSG